MEILRLYAHLYLQKYAALSLFSDVVERAGDKDFRNYQRLPFLLSELNELSALCKSADLPVTRKAIHSAIYAITSYREDNPQVFNKAILHFLENIKSRLPDELETKLFLQLPHSRRDYFDTPRNGWEEIIGRFPDTATDIEEMSKCFALSRYAGCVFHSLLVVEVGLIELGKELGVTDPKSGWDATCNKMKQLVEGGHAKYPTAERVTYSGLEQINNCAQMMKLAWRNKVNHAANRLVVIKPDFAPDVAEEIMTSSRGFMRRLMEELPQ